MPFAGLEVAGGWTSAVGFPAVTDAHDSDLASLVIYLVHNPVVSNSHGEFRGHNT